MTLVIPKETSWQAFLRSSQKFGSSADDLRIGMSGATSTIPSRVRSLLLRFKIPAVADFVLNLGVGANGKAMLPSAVQLLLADRIIGRRIELQCLVLEASLADSMTIPW